MSADAAVPRPKSWAWPLVLGAALLVAFALRAPAVRAGYPYIAYVDEGYVLQPAATLTATGDWAPEQNNYPQLPSLAIAAAARLVALLVDPFRDAPLLAKVGASPFYEVVLPAELLLIARGLSVLLGLGIVAVAGLYARRLAGYVAGVVAAAAAALLPALVLRGSIVIVDLYAAFFVLAALALVSTVSVPRQLGRIALAGACCGLAAVSKYPAGLSGLAVVLMLLTLSWSRRQRLRAAAVASVAGVAAAAIAMPSLVLAPAGVLKQLRFQQNAYATLRTGSYWQQLVGRAEWDLPFAGPEVGFTFLALAIAGLVLAWREPRWRRDAAAWTLLAALMAAVYAGYSFRAFRNLLPLAALSCVAAGLLFARVAERLRRPVLVGATGMLLLLVLFGTGDVRHAVARARLVDSRTQAVDWLVRHRGGEPLTVVAETPLHPDELARLGRAVSRPWAQTRNVARNARPRFLLVPGLSRADGAPLVSPSDRELLEERYEWRAVFGNVTGPGDRPHFFDNRLRLVVYERRPDARDRHSDGP